LSSRFFGTPINQRPIGLLGVALAEGGRQLLRGAARAGDDENAGGVAVEAVHEARLLALRAGPGLQHLVDMPVDARAALHGDAGRLVQHDDLVVLMQQHARQQFVIR
jgi:hypothetical protein